MDTRGAILPIWREAASVITPAGRGGVLTGERTPLLHRRRVCPGEIRGESRGRRETGAAVLRRRDAEDRAGDWTGRVHSLRRGGGRRVSSSDLHPDDGAPFFWSPDAGGGVRHHPRDPATTRHDHR